MKAILTVIGKDCSGIIAKVSSFLADNNINIEDISQTIIQGNFSMIMLVNLENNKLELKVTQEKLKALAKEISVEIYLQNQDVFNAMHIV